MSFPDIARAFLRNIEYFLIAEPIILVLALLLAVMRSLRGPVFFPIRRWPPSTSTCSVGSRRSWSSICSGSASRRCSSPGCRTRRSFWGMVGVDPELLGVRRRGLPGRHRLGASEPDGGGAFARAQPVPDAALRRGSAGRPAGHPAAPERLHRPAEGHGAHRDRGRDGPGGVPAGADLPGRRLQLHADRGRRAVLPGDHDPADALHGLAGRPPARKRQAGAAL